jgi:hypothetical protein
MSQNLQRRLGRIGILMLSLYLLPLLLSLFLCIEFPNHWNLLETFLIPVFPILGPGLSLTEAWPFLLTILAMPSVLLVPRKHRLIAAIGILLLAWSMFSTFHVWRWMSAMAHS